MENLYINIFFTVMLLLDKVFVLWPRQLTDLGTATPWLVAQKMFSFDSSINNSVSSTSYRDYTVFLSMKVGNLFGWKRLLPVEPELEVAEGVIVRGEEAEEDFGGRGRGSCLKQNWFSFHQSDFFFFTSSLQKCPLNRACDIHTWTLLQSAKILPQKSIPFALLSDFL